MSIGRRDRAIGAFLSALVLLNVIGWALVWIPKTSNQWDPISSGASRELGLIEQHIPNNDEVVASQGIMGPLAGRRWIYGIFSGREFPVDTKVVWFIIAPRQGIEIQSPAMAESMISYLSSTQNAHLMYQGSGVWAFRVREKTSTKSITIGKSNIIDAWIIPGVAGKVVDVGARNTWYLESNGASGYVLDHDYFFSKSSGTFEAKVEMSSNGPTGLEVWDSTRSKVLARLDLVALPLRTLIKLKVPFNEPQIRSEDSGFFIWRNQPQPRRGGDQLEIRIFNGSNELTKIFSVELVRLK
jgi:hypothetical protein